MALEESVVSETHGSKECEAKRAPVHGMRLHQMLERQRLGWTRNPAMQHVVISANVAHEPAPIGPQPAHPRRAVATGGPLGKLLAGPIIPTLLKLAAPTVVVLVVQTLVSVIETY